MRQQYILSSLAVALGFLLTACDHRSSATHINTDAFMENAKSLQKTQSREHVMGVSSSDTGSAMSSAMFPFGAKAIRVDNIAGYVGDKVTVSVDVMRETADMFNETSMWSIVDAGDNEIFTQEGGFELEWVPDKSGQFRVNFTVIRGELEIKLTERLYVLDKIAQDADLQARFWELDEKLLGTWVGKASNTYDNRDVSIVFNEDGSLLMGSFGLDVPFMPFPDPYYMDKYLFDPMPMPMPMPMPPMGMPYDYSDGPGLIKQNGRYELLDIWANGEGEGIIQLNNERMATNGNFRRIRFSSDYSLLFFEWSRDTYSDPELFILSKAENLEPILDLETMKASLIGSWEGELITRWAEPYQVSFSFEDGQYLAESLTSTRVIYTGEPLEKKSAFYFGAVENEEKLAFELTDFNKGKAAGSISLKLKTGEIVSGTIQSMEMSLDRNILVFTFLHYGKYGPMHYILRRQ